MANTNNTALLDEDVVPQDPAPQEPNPTDSGTPPSNPSPADIQAAQDEFLKTHPDANLPASHFQDYGVGDIDTKNPQAVQDWHAQVIQQAQTSGEIPQPEGVTVAPVPPPPSQIQPPGQPMTPAPNYPVTPPKTQEEKFLQEFRPYADKYSQQTGIPAEIFLAIGASESNWGRAGSIFGIKGEGPGGSNVYRTKEVVNGQTIETSDKFAAYNTPDEAFEHFISLLGNSRYKPAMDYFAQSHDIRGMMRMINQAGYATDPHWGDMIVGLAESISGGKIPQSPIEHNDKLFQANPLGQVELNLKTPLPGFTIKGTKTPQEIFDAQQSLFDSVNHVTDNPMLATLMNEAMQGLDDGSKKAALQNFQDVYKGNTLVTSDHTSDVNNNDPEVRLNAAWGAFANTIKDTMGNAAPQELLDNIMATGVASLVTGGLAGGATGAAKMFGLGTASVLTGYEVDQHLPANTPDWMRQLTTTFFSTLPFTAEQGLARGVVAATGAAVAQTATEQGIHQNIPGINVSLSDLPLVNETLPLVANIVGAGITSAHTPEVSPFEYRERTPEDVASGRYVLTSKVAADVVAGVGGIASDSVENKDTNTLIYHETPQGAHVDALPDSGTYHDLEMFAHAMEDIRSRNPNAVITTEVHTPQDLALTTHFIDGSYHDESGNILTPAEVRDRQEFEERRAANNAVHNQRIEAGEPVGPLHVRDRGYTTDLSDAELDEVAGFGDSQGLTEADTLDIITDLNDANSAFHNDAVRAVGDWINQGENIPTAMQLAYERAQNNNAVRADLEAIHNPSPQQTAQTSDITNPEWIRSMVQLFNSTGAADRRLAASVVDALRGQGIEIPKEVLAASSNFTHSENPVSAEEVAFGREPPAYDTRPSSRDILDGFRKWLADGHNDGYELPDGSKLVGDPMRPSSPIDHVGADGKPIRENLSHSQLLVYLEKEGLSNRGVGIAEPSDNSQVANARSQAARLSDEQLRTSFHEENERILTENYDYNKEVIWSRLVNFGNELFRRTNGREGIAPLNEVVDFQRPQQTESGLSSRFAPVFDARDMIEFESGHNSLQLHLMAPGRYDIAFHRDNALNGMTGRNPEGSNIKELMGVRAILSDLLINNPLAEFWAHPTEERRERIYSLYGFDKPAYQPRIFGAGDQNMETSNNGFEVGALKLNRDTFRYDKRILAQFDPTMLMAYDPELANQMRGAGNGNYSSVIPIPLGPVWDIVNKVRSFIDPRIGTAPKNMINPVGDLRGINEYMADINGNPENGFWRTFASILGINPGASGRWTDLQQATLARTRLLMDSASQAEYTARAMYDVYQGHVLGFVKVFEHPGGRLDRIVNPATKKEMGTNDFYEDVYNNDIKNGTNRYNLTERQLGNVRDAFTWQHGVDQLREMYDLPKLSFAEINESLHRQVTDIRDMDVERPSRATMRRLHEMQEDGQAAGVTYEGIRGELKAYQEATYREIIDKQFADLAAPYTVNPTRFIPKWAVDGKIQSAKNWAAARSELAALQRNRIKLQTANTESNVLATLRQANFATRQDLAQAIGQIQQDIADHVATVRALKDGKMPLPLIEQAEEILSNSRAGLTALRQYNSGLSGGNTLGAPVRLTRQLLQQQRQSLMDANQARIDTAKDYVKNAGEVARREKATYARLRDEAEKKFSADAGLFGGTKGEEIPITLWRQTYLSALNGKYIPTETAEKLQEMFATPKSERSLFDNTVGRGIEVVGNLMRSLALFVHFTAPITHGLPTFATNPVAWAEGTFNHLTSFIDPTIQARYIRKNLASIQEMTSNGVGGLGDADLLANMAHGPIDSLGQLVGKLPAIGGPAGRALSMLDMQTYGRSSTSYSTALLIYRHGLWTGLRNSFIGNESELASFVNNATGGLESRRLGAGSSQRQGESTWMAFSPRLMRSSWALMADAVRGAAGGLLNPRALAQTLGGVVDPSLAGSTLNGRSLAFSSMARLLTSAMGIYTLAGVAMGKDWDEIKKGLDPREGAQFLGYNIDGHWYGVGSEFRSIMHFMSSVGSNTVTDIRDGTVRDDPVGFLTDAIKNPIVSYWSSRGSPAWNLLSPIFAYLAPQIWKDVDPYTQVSDFRDLFYQERLRSLPFAAAELAKDGKDSGKYPAAWQIFGGRSSPVSAYDQLTAVREEGRNFFAQAPDIVQALKSVGYDLDPQQAQNMQGVFRNQSYNELGAGEQKMLDAYITQKYPEIKSDYEDSRRKRGSIFQITADRVSDARAEFNSQYDALWDDLKSGRKSAQQVNDDLGSLRDKEQDRLEQFYKAKDYTDAVKELGVNDIRKEEDAWFNIVASNTDKAGHVDWDKVDAEREAFTAKLTKDDPNMAARLKIDLDLEQQYSKTQKPQLLQFKEQVDDMRSTYNLIRKAVITDPNNKDQIKKADTLQEQWLQQNPTANAYSWVLYGTEPRTVEAASAALSMGIDRHGKDSSGRDMSLRLEGSEFEVNSQNIDFFTQHAAQVNTLLSSRHDPPLLDVKNGGRTTISPSTMLREQSPAYDTLYYLLWARPETAGLYKGYTVVYHDVNQVLRQWNIDRPDHPKIRIGSPRIGVPQP